LSGRSAGIFADNRSTVHTSASDLNRLTEDLKDMIDEFKVERSSGCFGHFPRPFGSDRQRLIALPMVATIRRLLEGNIERAK